MGFADDHRNSELLIRHRLDLHRVVEDLVATTPAAAPPTTTPQPPPRPPARRAAPPPASPGDAAVGFRRGGEDVPLPLLRGGGACLGVSAGNR